MYLGIDTSCYTTSAAVVDERGAVVWDRRIPLKVKENGRGLRQSEMVFQHVKNLPLVMPCGIENFHAVGVSAAPRPQEGRDREASFSGAETAARRLLEKGASKPHVAYAIEECIANTLIRLADSAVKQYGKRELLLCGGVMRNAHICRMVREQAGTRVILAGKEYSSDNACGIAAQARLIDRNRGDQ